MEGGEILEPVSCGAPVRSMCVYSKVCTVTDRINAANAPSMLIVGLAI